MIKSSSLSVKKAFCHEYLCCKSNLIANGLSLYCDHAGERRQEGRSGDERASNFEFQIAARA